MIGIGEPARIATDVLKPEERLCDAILGVLRGETTDDILRDDDATAVLRIAPKGADWRCGGPVLAHPRAREPRPCSRGRPTRSSSRSGRVRRPGWWVPSRCAPSPTPSTGPRCSLPHPPRSRCVDRTGTAPSAQPFAASAPGTSQRAGWRGSSTSTRVRRSLRTRPSAPGQSPSWSRPWPCSTRSGGLRSSSMPRSAATRLRTGSSGPMPMR